MRPTPNNLVEKHRLLTHPVLATTIEDGNNGVFIIPYPGRSYDLICVVSDERDAEAEKIAKWEHVSVHCGLLGRVSVQKTPTWDEMCFVKNLFWTEDEVVMQLHPAKKDCVNTHQHTLHLWRPLETSIPLPDKVMV